MVTAAKALKAIVTIKEKCKGQRTEALIIQAWEEKASGSIQRRYAKSIAWRRAARINGHRFC